MKLQKSLIMLFTALLLWNCENMVEDLGEDKLPKSESKLTVECYISPQMEKILVVVTESQPLYGTSDYNPQFVTDARVVLSGEQGQIEIPYDSLKYAISTEKFKIEAGKKYDLLVTDGTRTVKASCTVPAKQVEVKSYEMDTIYDREYKGDRDIRIRMAWNDIPHEPNYYFIRGKVVTTINYPAYDSQVGNMTIQTVERTNTLYFDGRNVLFTDINLDGRIFDMPASYIDLPYERVFQYTDVNGKVHTYTSETKWKDVELEIMNMDENHYRFTKSLTEHRHADNPFAEPVPVYSNVEGGLGCFGAYNSRVVHIKP